MGKESEKKLFAWVFRNYTAGFKVLLTTLLVLYAVITLLQSSRFIISASDLGVCISKISHAPPPSDSMSSVSSQLSTPLSSSSPPPSTVEQDQLRGNGTIKQAFNAYGSAACNFITMGAYRGGLNTFAIVGLASKPLHVYGKPTYECEWAPSPTLTTSTKLKTITTVGYKILPDCGFGRVYTAMVVNCTFSEPLNVDNAGGKLVLYASTSGGGDSNLNVTDRMEVLTESPGSLNTSLFTSEPKYDYFYCGSPLYGDLNPQRVREWIAYHVNLFETRSHFVIHDAGGVHEQVLEVLRPWMEVGYVTLQDMRDQERFDGFYHNQFMVLNDCLHRYKFMAKWMFFFDVDDYIYVPPNGTIKTLLESLSQYSQFTIEPMIMSTSLCLSADAGETYRKWGFEKLVYKNVKKGIRRNRKYAVQPRSVFATGVHLSLNLAGRPTFLTERNVKYFHYHGIIAERGESCKMLVNSTQVTYDKTPCVLDTTMRDIAGVIKKFEITMIGPWLQQTGQE